MSKEKHIKYSRHHILPRHPYGNDSNENIELLKDNYHRAIHQLFENKLIAEQLLTTIDISAKALRKDVREWLIETLNSRDIHDPYEWYDDKVIRF
jgi:hypothetical protein